MVQPWASRAARKRVKISGMSYTCKNHKGEISVHEVPCRQVAETIEVKPAHVVLDWKAVEGYIAVIAGLLIFSVMCFAIAKIGENWLKAKEKKDGWQKAIAESEEQERQRRREVSKNLK